MGLARSMGKPFFEVLAWSEDEVIMQMAYDMAQDDAFIEQCRRDEILSMTPEQRVKHDRALWTGRG